MPRNIRSAVSAFGIAASCAAALEFALVLPFLMLLLFGIMGFGWFLGIALSLQEAASQSARASVAGMDAGERSAVALATARRRTVDNPLISPDSLTVDARADANNPYIFTVNLRYDLNANLLKVVSTFVPLPATLTRTASIRRGGL